MSCEEQRKLYRLFIERIEVYPEHPDEQIVFTLDCGELGLTASEAKATYA